MPARKKKPKKGEQEESASRFYVVDSYNYRVQYFRDTTSGVALASLGRVKAVFR
jgi:hypothetical protein